MKAASEETTLWSPPTELDFEKALMFFHAYMYGPLQGKLRLYGARGIPPGTVAMSSDWEVFASMLVKDLGRKLGAGVDLANCEVKSAKRPGGYEYQYHRVSGKALLVKDSTVGHLFFDYHDNLKDVDLRYIHGAELADFFPLWLQEFPDPYRQRYRKSIPYGFVKQKWHTPDESTGWRSRVSHSGGACWRSTARCTPKSSYC